MCVLKIHVSAIHAKLICTKKNIILKGLTGHRLFKEILWHKVMQCSFQAF